MTAVIILLALIWGLPLAFVVLVGAAMMVSSSAHGHVREILFG